MWWWRYIHTSEENLKVKQSLLLPFIFIFGFTGLVFTYYYHYLGFPAVVPYMGICSASVLCIAFVGFFKGNNFVPYTSLLSNFLIGLYLSILVQAAYYTGGFKSPAGIWLASIILLAFMLVKFIDAIFWTFMTFFAILTLLYLEIQNPNLFYQNYDKLNANFIIFSHLSLGFLITALTIVTEIIKEKILEQNRFINLKLERHNVLTGLGEMAAGIAHEINNPLQIIHGKSIILKRNISKESYREDFTTIQNNVFKIKNIIHGLKSLSRDGTFDSCQKIILGEHIESVLNIFDFHIKSHSINLTVNYHPELYCYFREVQFEQVLTNLMNNAIDHLKENFEVSDRWIKIVTRESEHHAYLSIENNGDKFSKEQLIKIFTPFYTTKSVGKGTGLGLSVSSSILEKNGGELYVDQQKDSPCFVMKLAKELKGS